MRSFLSTLLVASLSLASTALVACGGGTDDSAAGTITQAFQSNCARCHGNGGKGMGDAPAIPGDLGEAEFVSTVRSGKGGGEMPAFSASQISDDDLKAAYAALKANGN